MLRDKEAVSDDSPTDELPVLSELDIVEHAEGDADFADDAEDTGVHPIARNPAGTPGSPSPSESAADDAPGDPDALKRRAAELESRLEDRDATVASLEERLQATRQAVARRDETERTLRGQLEALQSERASLESRLADAETLAAAHASRVAETVSRMRTLELEAEQRDAAFAELEAELVQREAQVGERERRLADAETRLADAERRLGERELEPAPTGDDAAEQPADGGAVRTAEPQPAPASAPAGDEGDAAVRPRTVADLRVALQRSREEAAALAAYIDCRRTHWHELAAHAAEQRARIRELERELEQRRTRELRAPPAADAPEAATGEEPAASPPAQPDRPAAARPRAPVLVCLTSDPPREYRVGRRALTIGRSPECDIQLVTHFVSREHARLSRDRDAVWLEDLGSKNGVFVNAVRIDREALHDGDLLTIGETQFRYRDG